jgi:uncharacterized protein YndB with AHSA1/START domain
MDSLGTYEVHGNAVDLRFERHYPRSVETVWAALTDPERLADWSMGPAEVEPRKGGKIILMGGRMPVMSGRILTWEPPRLLEYSWEIGQGDPSDCYVRWELTPAGDGTDLVLEHRNMAMAVMHQRLSGWHAFTEQLDAVLAGRKPEDLMARYSVIQPIYIAHYKLDVPVAVACAS